MDWIHQLWSEFTGTHYDEITIRLFLATLLGGLVGIEREQNNHPAGFRTHILVCVGSSLIMLISMYGFESFIYNNPEINTIQDPARLAAQVVSGIGFLGAGTILVHGGTVRGLTTAASLWVVAGIGLALGSGFYYGAVLSTVLVLLSLVVLNRIEDTFIRKGQLHVVQLKVLDSPGKLGEVATRIGEKNISIRKITINETKIEEGIVQVSIGLRLPQKVTIAHVLDELRQIKGILDVSVE
ncbi:MgtC/SapB family protein [Caldalkalibacillus salinus]|uniref:MgtC/SapB family protein n=1 Tax=Caldalkalibacillus salinus TaxID=2803787 RepID=UPI001F210886|nr:MgtC/SapB family protein [Caldalkalibacillus salinus]